ncbi:(2fe-2s)-binding protein : Rieske (2Fe-2S) domain protein OS=Roseiflexus sp. (strain RS-1) GN=RoseRS_0979 PE=4 SV=1: Rieske: Ring_hydroxyl_A [Gemmataceae bacterium]|nr:(2fe-2s)-binding protein : Rieske (2Fe-2S) domain protein OS=Roseiflexus sp. (strain RS-1) GN=RoseRS_0979 PE=4 SV=1: Rieske: Ring_hydroxyl_A [Gemmataceae bacterium]VTT97823.1 (2fe-2s)-binding protein : Rieske (2Fe-2S) domain protein OS=Roseiflexus sp. (strain RS-1) GN=RoseRS_0979 PE=4 SV=1: Rieske: Ring_hydroxyl_A [Gemmataceae bacterium]
MSGTLPGLLAQFDPSVPLEKAHCPPNTWYTSAEVAKLERDAVFARTWQVAGRRELVASPGQFLTTEVADEPILVVRGDDGVLRAFVNVCRHRAARVCSEECGTVTKLRCHYHGWTYDLAGNLRGVPEFDGVEGFRREDNGLPPVSVAEWGPYVWVHLEKPAEPLEQFLAPLPAWAASRDALKGLVWHARKTYDLACNWKVYVDNYLDGGYHVNTVHPGLAGVLDYREYRTVPDGNTVLQSSPMKPGDGEAGRTRIGDLAAYWWVFPNAMVNLYSGVLDTNVVVPLAVDRCRVIFDLYFAADADPEFVRESLLVTDQVQAEDVGVCEEVQRNLTGRSYTAGRYSVKRENGEHYFHQMLARALEGRGQRTEDRGQGGIPE